MALDFHGDYASGSYRARALQTDNFAQRKHRGEPDVKAMLSNASTNVHYAKRRASQVIFSNAAEMSVEARLQEEFRTFMLDNPVDEPSVHVRSFRGAPHAPHDASIHLADEEEDMQMHDMQLKRLAAQSMQGKSRRKSFVAGADGSNAASLLGQLRGLREYGAAGAGPPGGGVANGGGGEAAAAKPAPHAPHAQEKKVLASTAKSNPVLKKLMRRSALLGDLDELDTSVADDDADDEADASYSATQRLRISACQIQDGGGSPRSPGSRPHAPPDDDHGPSPTSSIHGQLPALSARVGHKAGGAAGAQSAPGTSRASRGAGGAVTARPAVSNGQIDLSCVLGLPPSKEGMAGVKMGRRASVVMQDDSSGGAGDSSGQRAAAGRSGHAHKSGGGTVGSPTQSITRSLSLSRHGGAGLDGAQHGGGGGGGFHSGRPAAAGVTSQSHDGGSAGNGFLSKMKDWITRR